MFPRGSGAASGSRSAIRQDSATARVPRGELAPEALSAEGVTPLDELRERRAEAVQVRLDAAQLDDDLIGRLRAAVAAHRGEVALFLEVGRAGDYRMLARAEAGLRVAPSRSLTRDIEAVVGPGRVRYRARAAR